MIEDIVEYQEALALSQIGFVQSCWHAYHDLIYPSKEDKHKLETIPTLTSYIESYSHQYINPVLAPTYSQAFRWFREKYDIHYSINRECSQHDHKWGYNWSLYNYTGIFDEYLTSHPDAPSGEWVYKTYEEAELACLKKLIETVRSITK
jgi:hypothetical protein